MSDGFLNLNFSDQEASSEVREFSTLPSGAYLVAITDIEMKESTNPKTLAKHNGVAPYAAVELTVQEDGLDGKYIGQKAWWNVMLFEGALYSLAQLMKAWDLVPGQDAIPDPEEWVGKTFVMVGRQEQAKTKDDASDKYVNKYEEKDGKRVPVMRYEVKGAKHPNEWASITKGKSSVATAVAGKSSGPKSLLPS